MIEVLSASLVYYERPLQGSTLDLNTGSEVHELVQTLNYGFQSMEYAAQCEPELQT